MGKIKLLDCTLRDGGYVNNWCFGHSTMINIFERLVCADIDIIEVGFIDSRENFNPDRSIMPDSSCAERIFGCVEKKNSVIVGMIDYGTCPIENIQPCSDSYLDGIRVIFKEPLMYEALDFCRSIKEKGYKVFVQMVSVTTYTDDKLTEFSQLVNEFKPFAVSIVDTYGLLHQENLMHIFEILDKNLMPEIAIGYHSHNNFQLAYANCIEFLASGVERDILADGTLYGMGKSAGNAPIELLAMHMNDCYGKGYDISQLLEAIDTGIMEIYTAKPWGYNLLFYISASNKCHPAYVTYLMEKHTLSVKSVNIILAEIESSKKLTFDKKYIEQLYLEFQKRECEDSADIRDLTDELSEKNVLVIGPGKTISNNKHLISDYIKKKAPVVFSINFIPSCCDTDYLFITNSKRYMQLSTILSSTDTERLKTISTSNVTPTGKTFSYRLNYSSLIDETADIPDNSLIMLLKAFLQLGVSDITLAGFDGYSQTSENYYLDYMEYSFAKERAQYLNNYTRQFLRKNTDRLNVKFITPSYYENY